MGPMNLVTNVIKSAMDSLTTYKLRSVDMINLSRVANHNRYGSYYIISPFLYAAVEILQNRDKVQIVPAQIPNTTKCIRVVTT